MSPGGLEPLLRRAMLRPNNGKIYAANIRDALIAADPAGKATYEANAKTFIDGMTAMETNVKAAVAKLAPERRKIIRISNCSNKEPCITAPPQRLPETEHLIGRDLSRGYGGAYWAVSAAPNITNQSLGMESGAYFERRSLTPE